MQPTELEPNPYVALNNARAEARGDHPMRTSHNVRLVLNTALDDKSRLDWLIEMGATWQVPFLSDTAISFHRGQIDEAMRRLT